MNIRTLALALAGLCLSAAASADQASQIHASGAWIRVLPGALPAGAYVQLQNDGAQPARLTGASSARYARVMLHRSSSTGGMSTMSAVDALEIPAHGQAALAPGDYHLMLMQPVTPVRPGDTVTLQLTFADGSTLDTRFAARPANALDAGEAADRPAAPLAH
ncbi:MAG: copper chaperone PCu(A)C [Dyella sp.]